MPSLLWFPITFMLFCEVNGASFTKSPTPASALIYSLAKFQCEGTGDILQWTVQNKPLNESIEQERNITVHNNHNGNNLLSTLTVSALPINNNIEIGCIIVSLIAEEVTLTVKGVSEAENIKWFPEIDLLTWSPPTFYSTDIENPTFNYGVLMSGISIINTTKTNASLDTYCEQFNISIVVYTELYMSQENNKKEYDFGNYNITIANYTVALDDVNNTINVSLIILVENSDFCNNSKINGSIENNKNGNIHTYEIIYDGKEEVIQHTIHGLELHTTYTAKIFIINPIDVIEDQDDIKLSTYYVQDLAISYDDCKNASISLMCIFLQGLTNKGCQVVFRDASQALEKSFNITGSEQEPIQLLYGNFSVAVYDILDNGSVIGPAFIQRKELYTIDFLLFPSICNISDVISTVLTSESNSKGFTETPSTTVTPSNSGLPPNAIDRNMIVILSVAILIIAILIMVIIILIIIIVNIKRTENKNKAPPKIELWQHTRTTGEDR